MGNVSCATSRINYLSIKKSFRFTTDNFLNYVTTFTKN